jgi:hypothetical protein
MKLIELFEQHECSFIKTTKLIYSTTVIYTCKILIKLFAEWTSEIYVRFEKIYNHTDARKHGDHNLVPMLLNFFHLIF